MKFIFDFDDTLSDTAQFKEYMWERLEKLGVPRAASIQSYEETRGDDTPFSLKQFLLFVFTKHDIAKTFLEDAYGQIMQISPSLLDERLLDVVRRAGKDNCYIVTNGDEEFQRDKIEKSGVRQLFREVFIVPGTKKETVAHICEQNPNEEIIFMENKAKFFDDLDMERCKNLKTVLWDEYGLEKLRMFL